LRRISLRVKALPKSGARNPGTPPPAYSRIYPHHEAPWGTPPANPAQGLATYKPPVLQRQCGGGLYRPSPSPPGFPLSKSIGGVCSLHSATLRSGRKPVPQRLKGGGTALSTS
jgi:hypothetical protein